MTPEEAFDQLHNKLRRYRLDTGLATVHQLYLAYEDPSAREKLPQLAQDLYPATISLHQLAYIAKALIRESNDYRSGALDPIEYVRCAHLYNHAHGMDVLGEPVGATWPHLMLRIAYQQFPHQASQKSRIPRTLYLYDEIARRPEFSSPFNIPEAFAKLVGLSVEEFMRVGLATFGRTASSLELPAFFQRDQLVRADVPGLVGDKVDRFLQRTLTNYSDFRNACDKVEPDDRRFALYAFNPLEATPIVSTDRSGLIVPIPRYLIDRITTGLFYDLMTAYGNPFATALGHVFEAYVGELLATEYAPEQLVREHGYGSARNSLRTTDWTVIEGDSAVLIECKSARLTQQTKVTADAEQLRKDLLRGIVQGVKQLVRLMQDIERGESGLEDYHSLRSFQPVVLLLDSFLTGNQQEVRTLVAEELASQGIAVPDYQVIGIEELEQVLPKVKQYGFSKLLTEKNADVSNPFHSTAFWSFDTFVNHVSPEPAIRGWNQLFEDRWEPFWRGLLEQFPEHEDRIKQGLGESDPSS